MSAYFIPIKRAVDDQSGAVALIFALACAVILMSIGLAIDVARHESFAGRLQQSLDGTALTAAKMLSDLNVKDDEIQRRAEAFFRAQAETIGIPVADVSPLKITIDRSGPSVEVLGNMHASSLFGGLFTVPRLQQINRRSKVIYDMTSVELAMVLDITGSMSTKGKLQDLKHASKDVIDTLFDGALNDTNVKIALAPYSASVNAGEFSNDVTALPTSTSCYKPCWWCQRICTNVTGSLVDTCVLERQGGDAFTDAAPSGVAKLPNVSSLASIPPNYTCPTASVIPLSDRTHRDDLKAAIDGYAAGGATAGHIGTAWGWYLLSPSWANVFPAESAPGAYGDSKAQKSMIVMTDGEFNTSYTGAADQTAASYDYFDQLCAAVKADGITVYTVGFDLNLPAALAHLQSCASSAQNFYDAKTGAQLKDAFKDIANKLGNLHVSQ